MGVPRMYCECAICMEARLSGVNRRFRSLVSVEQAGDKDNPKIRSNRDLENRNTGEDGFLIDCGPDWRGCMERRGQRFAGQVLVTHAHFDHIGGLPEWADACRWLERKGQLYAPQEVLDTISEQFPWLNRHIDVHAVDEGVTLAGWQIRGWKVHHGKNGFSYAYRLEKNGYAWAYCPDSIALPPEQRRPLAGLDLLVLGTSFYHEEAEFSTRSVYDVTEALELLEEVQPKRTIFTHMSHDLDLRRDYRLPEGVEFAMTGMVVPLTSS